MSVHARIATILILAGGILAGLLLVSSRWYRPLPNEPVKEEWLSELRELGAQAVKTRDVPIAALVVHEGRVIGRGFNTVTADGDVGGHAEIRAISDAVRRIGTADFFRLNRDSLALITTFEPCLMCRGAIIEHNIRRVIFLKPKPFLHGVRNRFLEWRYEWNKRRAPREELQDSLFRLHPDFDTAKAP